MLLVTLFTVQAAWSFDGVGTEGNPYLIKSAEDWNTFATNVAGGTNYSGQYVKLDASISVTSMVGTSEKSFSGTFDGGGNTITATINVNEYNTALFRSIKGATIKNLTLAGTIEGSRHTAAIVGASTDGNSKIQDCTVTATVTCTEKYVGGILGHAGSYSIAIERCVFSGKLVGGSDHKGVFIGWGNDGSGGSTVTDCLFLMQNDQSTDNLDLADNTKSAANITFTRCYKTTDAGTYGTRVYTAAPAGEISQKLTLFNNTYYRPCTVSGVESSYQLSTSPSINPTVTIDDVTATYNTDYTAELNGAAVTLPYTITAKGDYTLTLKGTGNYAGEKSVSFIVLGTLSGAGTEGNPFIINSTADWETLAQNVNNGTDYSGKYFQMTSDVSVTSMVGTSEANAFKGTFLGDGHTLTISISEGVSEQGVAPFHYINGATIKNLTVTGTITSSTRHTGGIVGFAYGTNVIDGCTVTVTINQDNDYAGGIIGHGLKSTTTIKDCVFAGTINGVGDSRNNIGGILGWNDSGTVTLNNCLEKGTFSNINSMHPIALLNGTYTVTDCYYLTPQKGAPSHNYTYSGAYQVSTSCEGEMYKERTAADGQTYYELVGVSGIKDFYLNTGSAIELNPAVTWEGTSLTLDEDYTATLNGSSVTSFPVTISDVNNYTLVLTSKSEGLSGSKTINFRFADYLELTSAHTTLENNYVYKLTSDITIGSRINVSGTVKLILGDGHTLTASKGIELSAGNQLTIEGEADNSGHLICNANEEKSGIGAYRVGTLIINGGTITATGGEKGAGIGGDVNSLGGSITINGGIVTAQGGRLAAGIGGGYNRWSGNYGQCPTVTINGGQVTANGGSSAPGIGPGVPTSEAAYNPSGTVRLGWTTATDFIQVTGHDSDYGFGQRIVSLGFVSGKCFRIGSSSGSIATVNNIKGVFSLKLVPADDVLILSDNDDYNTEAIAAAHNTSKSVVLESRTLYKDGKWNTICLPFDVTIASSPLDGATARTVTAASISGTTLNLTFGSAVTELVAGTPYIIKWANDGTTLTEADLVFNDVTISSTTHDFSSGEGDTRVRFMGNYGVMNFDATDYSILLMTGANTLRYAGAGAGLGACRAYFKIGEDGGAARRLTTFDLNFGDDETTGMTITNYTNSDDTWYTLDGRKLDGRPSVKGVYVNNGQKVVIK